jgi:hypothetical protein
MKLCCITAGLLLLCLTMSAQPLVTSPQPTRITERNNANGPLENSGRTTNYYNTSGHLTDTRVERWENNQWVLFETTVIAPNADGQPAQITHYNLYGTEYRRQYFTYDAEGRLTLWEEEINNVGTWVKINRKIRSYTPDGQYIIYRDENGSVAEPFNAVFEIIREYDAQYKETKAIYRQIYNNVVQFEREISSTYNAQGRLGTTIARIKQSNGSWLNQEKREFTYDNSSRVTYVKVSEWNATNSTWFWPGVSDLGYTYNPNQTILVLNPLGQLQYYRSTSNYNDAGQLLAQIAENWDNDTQSMKVTNKSEYNYNTDGSYASESYALRSGNVLVTQSDKTYEYTQFVDTQSPVFAAQISLFPNPASDMLWIDLGATPLKQAVHYRLFDAKGSLVLEQTNEQNNTSISLAALPSGAYYLQILHGANMTTLPVIKQ